MIICADLHLRHDTPVSRVDDYFEAQDRKFSHILELARMSPPLVVAGDFFHKPRPPIPLIRWVMDKLVEYDCIPAIIPGQHDLPFHSLKHIQDSGLGLLQAAGFADILIDPWTPYCIPPFVIIGCPFGIYPPPHEPLADTHKSLIADSDSILLLVLHALVIRKNEELWPGQKAIIAGKLLRDQPIYDFIISGDNHANFIEKSHDRRHINPGSMMRLAIDQRNHKPRVYEINTHKEVIEHFLPIEADVFDDSSITDTLEREERINSFVSHLLMNYEVEESFAKNVEHALRHVPEEVREIVRECLDQ